MAQMTKQAIANSLKHLLSKKSLSQITIADITADCGINRMTFYYHFQDIFDLIEWICQEEGAKAIQGRKDYQLWQDGFLELCRTIAENRVFVEGVYRSIQREHIENYLYQVTYHLLLPVIKEQSYGTSISAQDQQYIADFYKYAFVGVVLDWVKNGFQESPERISARISRLVHGQIRTAILNFSHETSP